MNNNCVAKIELIILWAQRFNDDHSKYFLTNLNYERTVDAICTIIMNVSESPGIIAIRSHRNTIRLPIGAILISAYYVKICGWEDGTTENKNLLLT